MCTGIQGHVTACFRPFEDAGRVCLNSDCSLIPRDCEPFDFNSIQLQQQGIMATPTKQATVYVIDLGSTMGECHNGRVETDLEFGMRYIWDKIATTMGENKKTANVGVIGFRTDGTNNPLDDDGYENISVSVPHTQGWLLQHTSDQPHVPPRSSNNICASHVFDVSHNYILFLALDLCLGC